jgi:1-acyl-sn-glycerol-3-phosphate acyltransferase
MTTFLPLLWLSMLALVASGTFAWLGRDALVKLAARLFVWVAYRFRGQGLDNIPKEGAAILVSNHVSFVDAILILQASPRPVRFVMDYQIYRTPVLNWVFRIARVIPIARGAEHPKTLERAYDAIAEALESGELVCLFPEGQLTRSGDLGEFKRGIERIVARTPVPVVPMALCGLWDSVFSRHPGPKLRRLPARLKSPVLLTTGSAIAPIHVTRQRVREVVAELRGAGLADPASYGT